MRVVNIHHERERAAFAERAAAHFEKHRDHYSYSESDESVDPGSWLALRWGMHNRAVLVLQVGDEDPIIYGDLIPMPPGPVAKGFITATQLSDVLAASGVVLSGAVGGSVGERIEVAAEAINRILYRP